MKLALIADTFPPLRTSGAVQLRDLTREFVRQGHQLTVLLPDSQLEDKWRLEEYAGAQVLRLRTPLIKHSNYVLRTLGEWRMPYSMKANLSKSPLADARWQGVVWYSPSIFHAPLVRAVKRRSACPGYLIVRDIFPDWAVDLGLIRKGPAYYFFRAIARAQYKEANTIGVQTPGNLAYFADGSLQAGNRKLEVLNNWLGAAGTKPCSIQISSTILAGRKIFVYAGNMGVAQGVEAILDMAHSLQDRTDIGFLFVGRGSEANQLRGKALRNQLRNVLFFDEIDPDEIPALYAQCAAGVVMLDPRHASHNIPGKFLTYMQNGLPVFAVVNAGNDLANLVGMEGVGVACETHEAATLRAHCLNLLTQIEKDAALPARCRSLFDKQFSVSLAVRQICAALSDGRTQTVQADKGILGSK